MLAVNPQPLATRHAYLDHLKIALTVLVILHHIGQAYGPTGGFWYFQNADRFALLGPFFRINASFFMGLFFLISGYFMPGSLDRKGAWPFVKDRLIRLGIPLIAIFATVIPALTFVSYRFMRGGSLSFGAYIWEVFLGAAPRPAGLPKGPNWPEMNFGHLWFVEHLLFYAACYALGRWILGRLRGGHGARSAAPPADWAISGYILALTAVTVVVRIWYPIDRWVGFLGVIQTEFAHVPQYLSFLVLGVLAYRRGWLTSFPSSRGMRWLGLGLLLSLAHVAGVMAGRWWYRVLPGWVDVLWESTFAVSISIGLLTLFRDRWNGQSKLAQALGADAFAAYLFHVPVIVGLQYAVAPLTVGALPKFLLVSLLGIPLTFGISHVIRRLPGAKTFL